MEPENIFNYIKAAQFFPKYAPQVNNWKNKLAGKSGRGKPLEFTEADKTAIKEGVKYLFKDLKK